MSSTIRTSNDVMSCQCWTFWCQRYLLWSLAFKMSVYERNFDFHAWRKHQIHSYDINETVDISLQRIHCQNSDWKILVISEFHVKKNTEIHFLLVWWCAKLKVWDSIFLNEFYPCQIDFVQTALGSRHWCYHTRT